MVLFWDLHQYHSGEEHLIADLTYAIRPTQNVTRTGSIQSHMCYQRVGWLTDCVRHTTETPSASPRYYTATDLLVQPNTTAPTGDNLVQQFADILCITTHHRSDSN